MNPFRPLLKLLDFVLGHDLHERAPEQKRPEVRRPPRRDSAPRGDGFDSGSGGPRVDLRGGVKAAPTIPDEPVGPPAMIEPSNFNASLDDLSHVVDEPMAPQAEFIPEGGMSTESLMREFSSLDTETQAAAVDLAAAKELAQSIELENPEKYVDSFESALPLPLPPGEGRGEGQPAPQPTAAAPLDFSHVVDEPIEAKPEFVAPGGMSTESLMGEFESLHVDAQKAAVEEAAAKELARLEAESESADEVDSFEASPAPQPQERMTPAWLIPATTAAPKPNVPLPPPEMSTESLMGEFESLTPDTQQAAIEEAAAKELARQEAEEAKQSEVALAPHPDPLPAPQGEGATVTPAWLLPVTTAAPPRPVAPPPPAMSTESLMSEFEPLDAGTQEFAREEALAPHPDPLPAPQGEGAPLTPAWLLPVTSAAPPRPVAPPPPAMSTESLMSEFESLDAETQQAAIDEAAAKELARQEAEAKKKAAEAVSPLPDPFPGGEREDD